VAGSPTQLAARRKLGVSRDDERSAERAHPRPFGRSRPTILGAADALALQQLAGNRAVQRLMQPERAKEHEKGGAHKAPVEVDEEDVNGPDKERSKNVGHAPAGTMSAGRTLVQREVLDFITGGKKVEFKPAWRPAPDYKLKKPSPKRSNSESSTCKPGKPKFVGHTAYETAAKKWRYQIESVSSPGTIQIVYYTKSHYPAPEPSDDSGELSNVTKKNWRAIVKDLRDNRTGVADKWSAYAAEDLHENYHWVDEWQKVSKPKFTEAENDIAALEEPEGDGTTAGPKDQYDANKILEPKAKKIFAAKVKEASDVFWNFGDSAGDPPYLAQAPAVDALIKRVEAKFGP